MVKYFFIFFPFFLLGQNVDMYLSLLHEGKTDGVREQLPELVSKYPNDPGVLFLQALLMMDGMKSLELYNKILEKFPESKYAPDAALKIGEYFYARGLYSQAGRQLSKLPRIYPRYLDKQRVVDLMVSSFKAIGEEDSVRYYVGVYKSMFPELDVEVYGVKTSAKATQSLKLKPKLYEPKPYIVQIGAFGNKKNAKRLQLQISQVGYEVIIAPVEAGGRKLHAVRVVRFKSKREAEQVGKDIKRKLGTDFRVLYRPKSQNK